MSRFAKEFVIYGVSGALSKIIMVFLVPIYTRVLTPSDYGILGLHRDDGHRTSCRSRAILQITMGNGAVFLRGGNATKPPRPGPGHGPRCPSSPNGDGCRTARHGVRGAPGPEDSSGEANMLRCCA